MTEPTTSGRAAEAELYVVLRKAGEDRHEAQALIDHLLAEAWTRGAGTVEAMNEGCSRTRPCASCDAREDAADALRDIARRRVARHNIERATEEQPAHPEQVTCMTSPKGTSKPTHACPPGCPGCNAPGGIGGCGPEDRPALPPRSALSAPHTVEPPAPGRGGHPGGENGPHTSTQDRAELCRRFEAALTRQWAEVARYVMDDVLRDVVDCHLDLVAHATAALRAELAIDTQVMEKADRECDEHIAAGRAFRQLAERTQAWGEQHRDRANRYRARVDRARRRLDAWEQQLPETVLTATVLEVLRGDLAPQAGDDTTGATP